MKTKDGFIQGYNAQAAVDATAQVIVAHGLDARQSDQHQLAPMADAIEVNLGKKPAQMSADAGYCSDANLAAMEEREIDAYIAPGRAKHAGEGEGGRARIAAMRAKIKAAGHASPYRLRKQLPEAGVRPDQAGARLPPVPVARRQEGRRRMGPRLPRPT
jgi:Transposase DDE domain